MKSYIGIAIVTVGMTCAGTAEAQDLLGRLLKVMRKPDVASRGGPSAMSAASASPTDAQLASIRRQIAGVTGSAVVRQDLAAASPIIEATVVAVSCATEATALRSLNGRRLVPHNYPTPDDTLSYTAMGGMRYHDRRTCVDLNRVAAVTKPALNALRLKLNFVSASSGEAKVQDVSFRKVGDQWLLDRLTDFDIDMP